MKERRNDQYHLYISAMHFHVALPKEIKSNVSNKRKCLYTNLVEKYDERNFKEDVTLRSILHGSA